MHEEGVLIPPPLVIILINLPVLVLRLELLKVLIKRQLVLLLELHHRERHHWRVNEDFVTEDPVEVFDVCLGVLDHRFRGLTDDVDLLEHLGLVGEVVEDIQKEGCVGDGD